MRITRPAMLMDICEVLAKRSTCPRGNIGALVWDPRINDTVSFGYNGSRPGEPHCIDRGCLMAEDREGCQRTDHAEYNALRRAAHKVASLESLHLYCTSSPCIHCAREILNSGVIRFYYRHPYRDKSGLTWILDNSSRVGVFRIMPSGVIISERTKHLVEASDIE